MAVPHLEVAYKFKWGAVLPEQINDLGESLENMKYRGTVNIVITFSVEEEHRVKLL